LNENRNNRRHPIIADIIYHGEGMQQNGRTSDLSEGGLFIDTMNPLPEGSEVAFRFMLPGDPTGKPVMGKGVVTWGQPTVGMGIRFTLLAVGDRERIVSYLATHQA
jgi:uncharacterized protein (TIGR02266 family)